MRNCRKVSSWSILRKWATGTVGVLQLAEVDPDGREECPSACMRSQLSKLDLLTLDELNYVPASTLETELFFNVISTAY